MGNYRAQHLFFGLACVLALAACEPAGAPANQCAALGACCSSGPGDELASCQEVAGGTDDGACSDWLASLRSDGYCTASGGDGGTPGPTCTPTGQECSGNECCAGNECFTGVCEACSASGQTCQDASQCCRGGDSRRTECVSNVCRSCVLDPGSCSQDSDCCGNSCVDGVCATESDH